MLYLSILQCAHVIFLYRNMYILKQHFLAITFHVFAFYMYVLILLYIMLRHVFGILHVENE